MFLRASFSGIYIYLFTILVFFTPIRFFGFTLKNELIFFAAFFLSGIALAYFWRKVSTSQLRIVIFAITYGMFFSIGFSFINFFRLADVPVLKDFVEPFKPFIYVVLFSSGFLLSGKLTEEKVSKYIVVWSVISVIFSAFVFFPAMFDFVDLYKGRMSTEPHKYHFYRFSGFLGYPGSFGYWLVLSIQVCFLSLHKKWMSVRVFYFIISILIIGLVFTGARGAIIVFILSSFLILVASPLNKINVFVVFVLMIFLIFATLFVMGYQGDLVSIINFQKALDSPTQGTASHRLGEIGRLFSLFYNENFIGVGPDNFRLSSEFGPVESAYYFYGYKFGLFGLLFYFSIIIFISYLMFRTFISRSSLNFPYFFFVWAFTNVAVAGLSNSVIDEYKSFYMFFVLFGISFGFYLRAPAKVFVVR